MASLPADPPALLACSSLPPQVMGRMVLAMKRFSNSLNPTYTYGKRPSSSTSSGSRRVRTAPAVGSWVLDCRAGSCGSGRLGDAC